MHLRATRVPSLFKSQRNLAALSANNLTQVHSEEANQPTAALNLLVLYHLPVQK